MACTVRGGPLSHRLTHEPRCNALLQKMRRFVRKREQKWRDSRMWEIWKWALLGVKDGWYGRIREVGREEVLSCNGAGARCSSFLDRNGGQVQLYVKATQGNRHTHKEKDGGEGVSMMTLTSGEGHSVWAHAVEILLTIANKERIRQRRGTVWRLRDGWGWIKGFMRSLITLIDVSDREG